jgi:hypothetical protein
MVNEGQNKSALAVAWYPGKPEPHIVGMSVEPPRERKTYDC